MAPITYGLINDLDASVLLLSGFNDGQNLQNAFIPDQVDVGQWRGWQGDKYGINLVANASPNGLYPVIRFSCGNLKQINWNVCLSSTNLTVMIAATRTGNSYAGSYMGLYSMVYNFANSGITMLAVTDNNFDRNYDGWGTYDGSETYQALSSMDLNTPFVLTMVGTVIGPLNKAFSPYEQATGTFYTNTSATGTFPNTKPQGYFGLGGFESAKGFFNGDLYEVLVYNRSLSACEVVENAQYLIQKWF